MIRLFGVYGASGCGRGIMPVARAQLQGAGDVRLVFIDDHPTTDRLNGHEVVLFDRFCREPASERRIAIAIADTATRAHVAERCESSGIGFFDVTAANAVRMDDVQVGEGALISPFVTFTSNIRIGRHFHANLYSCVEHDCVIGDFVTFAPGVKCNGNVRVEDGAYLGAGAIIRQGRPGEPLVIGAGAVVGMGAVVTHSVAPGAVVAGNPARPLEPRPA